MVRYSIDRERTIHPTIGSVVIIDWLAPGAPVSDENDALNFVDALGLRKLDLLGFSLGGFIAQQIAVERPEPVRKLVLVGTTPEGGEGLDNLPNSARLFGRMMRREGTETWNTAA